MDPADHIADLVGEIEELHGRVAELEEQLRQTREELRVGLERKVEEVTVFIYSFWGQVGMINIGEFDPNS